MDDKQPKDHKQIGQEQELFFTNEVAPGAPFWLPRGMIIFKELEKYIRELTEKAGYLETSTPIMVKSELFKQSGHWTKFGSHNMYNLLLSDEDEDADGISYTLKPMNCPESTVIYRFRPRSYRELPLRLSELGRLHRREKSGEVNGLFRVRQITMDDAHIFVTEDQIFEEIGNILDIMNNFYTMFGFSVEFKLATRPEGRAGTDIMWDKAEKDLEEVLKAKKIKSSDKKGDGAFYGPKIDAHIEDSLGRSWQLATVQLDFHMPEAFGLTYINDQGQEKRPVMIHRAILGSFERFIGILTEHYQGAFPIWLSPVQVAILPGSEKVHPFAQKILDLIKDENIRAELDTSNKTVGAKIREASLQRVPYLVIIGEKEHGASSEDKYFVSVRTRTGEDLGTILLDKFLQTVKNEIEKKS